MATTTIVTLMDSLDERITEDVETVTFFHPATGVKMDIELGAANRKAFSTHLERMNKYFAAAVPVEVETPKPAKAAKNSELAKIRAWAQAEGFQIGDRGRIKAEIMTAYTAAMEKIDSTEDKAEPTEPVSSEDVLDIMAELETEGREITEAEVKAKLDETVSA